MVRNPNPNTSGLTAGNPKEGGPTVTKLALSLNTDVLSLLDHVAHKSTQPTSRSRLISMMVLDGLEQAGHLSGWDHTQLMAARLAIMEQRRIPEELMRAVLPE